ncbi:MAG: ArsR family transcriptional regulator [Methanobacteriota archaeon]
MNRIKVVNEAADLVSIFRAVDTDVKKEVLKEVSLDWRTAREIKAKYGEAGKSALNLFDKMKLVETRWQQPPGATTATSGPEKAYHTYYSSFQITASCPIYEICDVLSVAVMTDARFKKLEDAVYKAVGAEGKFAGDIAEELKVSQTMMKSLVKRSSKLEYRGHRIERFKE